MQIFEGNEYELKTIYNLKAMSVVYVGILRKNNIYLTEPFLELCATEKSIEGILKDKELLGALGNFREFEKLQEKHDPEREYPLTLLDSGNKKIIALEAEIIAEAGWSKESSTESSALAPKSKEISSTFDIDGDEIFSKEEINQLKMTIATAVNSEEKIEAIRKIALSKLPLKEKGMLFLHALADEKKDVRKEAVQALGRIGFGEIVVESLVMLSEGDIVQCRRAIKNIQQIFVETSELERGAILQILLSILKDKKYKEIVPLIIETFDQMVPSIPKSSENMCKKIVQATIDILINDLTPLLEIATKLFKKIFNKTPQTMEQLLWQEFEKIDERRLRAFFLVLLAEMGEANKEELAKKMIFEIGFGDELDQIYLRLSGAIVKFGSKIIDPLLDRFEITIRSTERIQIIKLIDKILLEHKIAKNLKNKIIKTYTKIFPLAPNALKLCIMDTSLIQDEQVTNNAKTNFAHEMLADIHKEGFSEFYQAIKSALCRMKKPSLSALTEVIKSPIHPNQSIYASNILGEVVLALDKEKSPKIEEIKDFCFKQLKNVKEHKGELFKILGKIAYCETSDEDSSNSICQFLLENVCKTTHVYAVLEGLGWAASSNRVNQETKLDVFHLFKALMDRKLPENISKLRKSNQGKIFEFDFKTTAYTDLLPILTIGIKRVCLSQTTSKALKKAIVSYCLEKWENVISYKIIWGPKNTTDLAEVMQELCLHEAITLQDRIHLTKALLKKIHISSITEMLCIVFQNSQHDRFADLAKETAEQLIEFSGSDEYSSPEDKDVLMRCISYIIEAQKLAPKQQESENIRQKLLYILFDGQRDKVFGINNILHNLKESKVLSKKLIKEIEKRLLPYSIVTRLEK